MDQPVKLVPLVCLKCSLPIPADPDEVAWVCSQCGQGQTLDLDQGLLPIEVQFSQALPAGSPGKPYWVAEGRASLQRQTYGGNQDQQAQSFWAAPRRFYIPAFSCSLEQMLSEGGALLVDPPALQPGPAGRFTPVTLSRADVTAAAEFIVIALEAGRKDKLREIKIKLELSDPELWILP